ncbi:uncharacterized protein LOC121857158 [Homarus americanus]|uniref:Uncharacterized protein n=1 Tax=Homarus americanus TaxID=6706 RepID=A0A8J5JIM6_HOMAM|nr:uncharacterized protein LOC121857158 [Homarus americanus]KAG7153789.1 hypothetical protein Hamer_G009477 [Homarus americanus]
MKLLVLCVLVCGGVRAQENSTAADSPADPQPAEPTQENDKRDKRHWSYGRPYPSFYNDPYPSSYGRPYPSSYSGPYPSFYSGPYPLPYPDPSPLPFLRYTPGPYFHGPASSPFRGGIDPRTRNPELSDRNNRNRLDRDYAPLYGGGSFVGGVPLSELENLLHRQELWWQHKQWQRDQLRRVPNEDNYRQSLISPRSTAGEGATGPHQTPGP